MKDIQEKFLFDPTELLNEDSIELVYGEDLQEIYESVNNLLHPKSIDILEEQVNQLIYSINEYDIEDEYNVLPEDVPNLEELDAWKDRYNFMSRDKKKTSNAISVQRYGRDNITRYGILRHKFLSEDPGVDDHLSDIGDSIGIDPIVDDIFYLQRFKLYINLYIIHNRRSVDEQRIYSKWQEVLL